MNTEALPPEYANGTAWLGTPVRALQPMDAAKAQEELTTLTELAEEKGLSRLRSVLTGSGDLTTFLGTAASLSSYMRDGMQMFLETLEALFDTPLETYLNSLFDQIAAAALAEGVVEASIMKALRRLKREAHFLIGLGNLAGTDAETTVHRLSKLADACVRSAVNFLLLDAHRQGKLKLPDPANPGPGSGWIVLAMGKLGASELNYSSDIDLIVLVDPTAPAIPEPYEAVETFVRLTRRLIRVLQDRTEDGYVFRTDLRLRPDPGSTPLALPINAALHYYESRGQNWERAAMIKARSVAGDIAAGEAFLRELQPYVWRKYLDYAAIADVHSIKRQIHAHKGHGEVAVLGHNVKLGRGGIREIEFFVQTQQLIAGGRFPELRDRETVTNLRRLAARGWITPDAERDLVESYWFLRDVENVIQMVADEQTHILPSDKEGLRRIALLLGFPGEDAFAERLRTTLRTVEQHYAALFEAAPQLSRHLGNLVFTGDVDDPDTLETLHGLGFQRVSDICRVIRGWHFGRYKATQSAEARERLTELTPALLEAFGQTQRADEALMRFDEFLSGLPAGIQLFSLLQSNPRLLRMLVMIMGAAPRLAGIITKRPHVFDGLLDPALLSELPSREYLAQRLADFLGGACLLEETLDRLRIFAAEQRFLIGIRLLAGSIDGPRAGRAFSDLADLTIQSALNAVQQEFERIHGRVTGGRVAILGMGKLGSRELTAGSDVDLILLYDYDPQAEQSDGEKPLAPSQYYGRLTQRLIAAVSAPTAEGVLYELDLRLRPSGNKGPVATHIESFRKYQNTEAWTWEHMALTRARTIAGDEGLCADVEEDVKSILGSERSAEKIKHDASEMRQLVLNEKPPRNAWDLKLVPGGLMDLEFIAQVAVLLGQVDGPRHTGTHDILQHLSGSFADAQVVVELTDAHRLYTEIDQVVRLCLTGPLDPKDIPPELADTLLGRFDLPEFDVLEAHLQETNERVRAHFDGLIGT